MRKPLVIAVAQPVSVRHDVAGNAERHAAMVRSVQAQVVVFPELSLTGYELDAPDLTIDDTRLAPIVKACHETGALALVGAPVMGDVGRSHIAMLAVDGTGARVAYQKLWLSEEEARRFAPGLAPAVLEVDGWRLGLAICKDTGVPRHQADTAALGIDAYVAGTVMFAEETAELEARARRIASDYQLSVAFASFAGATGEGYERTAGCSGIWTSDGRALAQAGPEAGAIAHATLG